MVLRSILLAAFAVVTSLAVTVHANPSDTRAAPSDTILVFDASGSMWGQIDGKAKITIAREVVQGLLKDLPPERRLGLVAYGHRRKGDCKDILTLVPVGTDRAVIAKAIAAINPKGKTPMTAAVEHAAEELKYTENKATVILVSDGQETCHADPCAAAAKLEELGIGLTVHTIGFGLEVEELAAGDQLRCIAEATGGQFLEAHDADELRDALFRVSAAEPVTEKIVAKPVEVAVALTATDQVDGPQIKQGLIWTVRHGATGKVIYTSEKTGTAHPELPRGVHDVSVRRVSDGATAEGQIDAGDRSSVTLPIVVELKASVEAPDTGAAGSTVRVTWSGPDEEHDHITVAKPDAAAASYVNVTSTERGNPLELLLPVEPGDYEIRYISRKTTSVLASQPIKVTQIEASLDIPATAVAGSTVTVNWTGPDYAKDFISIAKVGASNTAYVNTAEASKGSPLKLLMPPEPGEYEVRYVQFQGRTVLAQEPITITDLQASVEVPATAPAGSTLTVKWTGPDYAKDFISIAKVGASNTSYVNVIETRKGSPLQLLMPAAPGEYEVRYVQFQGRTVLVHEPITITAVDASVQTRATAVAGSTVPVEWTGPDYAKDFISIAKVGSSNKSYANITQTSKGSPLQLLMPAEPGDYEVRYVQFQGRTMLAHEPIKITAAQASVDVPAAATAGATLMINWTGPDYHQDFISIAKAGSSNKSYAHLTYTSTGSPLELKMPDEPGDYEVRYVMFQRRTALVHKPIKINP